MSLHRNWLVAVAVALSALPAWADLRVELAGVDGPERANVEARLGVQAYADAEGDDEAQIRRLHRQAEDEIREALRAYGYYEPRVRGSLAADGKDWLARYEIEPGPPTLLESVRIEVSGDGRDFPALADAARNAPLRAGDRLQHERYEQAKAALARAAYDNGFLDARFLEHTLVVEPLRRRAVATLLLDTGLRYYFGEVSVAQEGLDPEFVARYVPIKPGAPFEPEKLLEAQFALSDLGYFGSIDVQARKEQAVDHRVPIVIATTRRPPQRYDAGVGYGTDTGARLTVGAEYRQLTDTGHKLRSDVRVSEIKNSIGLDYRIPLGTQAADNLGFGTTFTDEKVADGESTRYDFAVTLSRSPGDWQRQLYLKHQYEEARLSTAGSESSKLLMPGIALSRGEMDDPIHARLGWAIFLDLHGGHEAAVSDVNFLQGRVLLRGVVPLGERTRVLGRAEVAATLVEDFAELPVSQRFFAGGDQSVRGYAYQSLGPRDAAGKVIGGEYLTTWSGEIETRIWGNWGAAAFLDLGGVDDDPGPGLSRGVGAGVRYRAPIGTLQVDLAHPLDGDDGGVRLHIGIRVGL
ncbi:MAG TPA: autotransporter assembly complex family protein [Verrucomicrobiae bacterium]|nr:autotransporter assembly complex family protein [Verrucomicrobiae bacterium]